MVTREPENDPGKRIRLYEVADEKVTPSFGPEELLDAPVGKLLKLFKRFWAISPDEDFDRIHGSGETFAEYGHLVEVRNPLLSDELFETITGPFKNVDSRTLFGQILLHRPERKIKLKYSSGKRGRLLTLTKLAVNTTAEGNERRSSRHDLDDRAKRYKKKAKKSPTKDQKSAVVDDDIADLISTCGAAAIGEEKTGDINVTKSVNKMVDKWHVQESEKKVVVYESDSDSDLLAASGNIIRIPEPDNTMMGGNGRSCCDSCKTLCSCCIASKVNKAFTQPPLQVSPRLLKKHRLGDGKASQLLWQPHRQTVVKAQNNLKVPGAAKKNVISLS